MGFKSRDSIRSRLESLAIHDSNRAIPDILSLGVAIRAQDSRAKI